MVVVIAVMNVVTVAALVLIMVVSMMVVSMMVVVLVSGVTKGEQERAAAPGAAQRVAQKSEIWGQYCVKRSKKKFCE